MLSRVEHEKCCIITSLVSYRKRHTVPGQAAPSQKTPYLTQRKGENGRRKTFISINFNERMWPKIEYFISPASHWLTVNKHRKCTIPKPSLLQVLHVLEIV